MWELIRQNRRRSRVLMGLMLALMVVLGAVIGLLVQFYVSGDRPMEDDLLGRLSWHSVAIGAGAAFVVWIIQVLLTYTAGDKILLNSVGARRIEHEDAPMLWNVVEEM